MKFLKIRLKANSIIEVLVAVSIVSACFVIATMIFLNIKKNTRPFLKIKAIEIVDYCLRETIELSSLTDEVYQVDGLTVTKSVSTHQFFADCLLIRVIVYDRSKRKLQDIETTLFKNNRY